MSLVTLKKKSRNNRRFAPISGRGVNGFSLNGGYRNVGAVGQFRMISNNTRTPFRGTEPMGNGGSQGKYYNKVTNSGSCCTNDNEIIKKSSLNTAGMIDTKYKWTKGTYPNYWVQEDDNNYNITGDQGTYISNLTQNSGMCVFTNVQNNGNCGTTIDSPEGEKQSTFIYNCTGNKGACSYHIGGKKYVSMPYAKNFNQPAMSQGQYISSGGVAQNNCLPTPANKQPFPMKLNHNNGTQKVGTKVYFPPGSPVTGIGSIGCQTNYLRWEDAKNDGILPADWTPGYTEPLPDYNDLVQRSSNFPNPNSGVTPNT
tara:strand:- start:238 stop:1173 length:936 start_codon:yes stop_codon:yes gene_type:complete